MSLSGSARPTVAHGVWAKPARAFDLGENGDRPELVAHHLAGEFGHMDGGSVVGTFTTTEPFPVRIDLDALV